jgi:hypothetical protein
MGPGRVAPGGCPPEAPTDPYVPTLGHTVPQIIPSQIGTPSGLLSTAEAGTAPAAG